MPTEVTFYSWVKKFNTYPKTLSNGYTTQCNLITDTITDLTLTIETKFPRLDGYNYVTLYIDGRFRYYFISSYTCDKGLWYYNLSLDSLQTYWDDLKRMNFLIERSSSRKGRTYQPDSLWMISQELDSLRFDSSLNPFNYEVSNTEKCYTLTCFSTSGVSWGGQPPISANNPFTTTYAIDGNTLKNVANLLCDPSWWTSLQEGFAGDPIQSVIQVNLYPFILRDGLGNPFTTTEGASFNLGSLNVPDTPERPNKAVQCRYIQELDCGYITTPHFFNDWRDYSPYTNAFLFLPFYGIVEIDLSEYYITDRMYIKYIVDPMTGNCQIYVSPYEINSETIPTDTYAFNIASSVPITSTNAAQIKRGIVQSAATAGASIAMMSASLASSGSGALAQAETGLKQAQMATGKGSRVAKWESQGYYEGVKAGLKESAYVTASGALSDIGSTVGSALLAPRRVTHIGGIDGNPLAYTERNVSLVMTFPKRILENWQNDTYGQLLMEQVENLESLSGFCKIHKPIFNSRGMTTTIYNDVVTHLEDGFYIDIVG